MNQFVKTITSDKLCFEFLRSLNGLIGLTDRELSILSVIMNLNIEESRKTKQVSVSDNADIRKFLMSTERVTKDNLSRYMKGFKEKGLMTFNHRIDRWTLNKALVPNISNKSVQVSMILKIKDNDE